MISFKDYFKSKKSKQMDRIDSKMNRRQTELLGRKFNMNTWKADSQKLFGDDYYNRLNNIRSRVQFGWSANKNGK